MRIEILSDATEDLLDGYHFYERQAPGFGDYFLDSLYSDIDSLLVALSQLAWTLWALSCMSPVLQFSMSIIG
jgi:hypothetical protein